MAPMVGQVSGQISRPAEYKSLHLPLFSPTFILLSTSTSQSVQTSIPLSAYFPASNQSTTSFVLQALTSLPIIMSDHGRKGLGDSAQEKLTPDSQKSGVDKAKESVTGAYDKAAGAVQPEGDKSASQKASDTVSGSNTDNAENTGKTYLQTAQDAATDTVNKVSDTLGAVADSISGSGKK